jgi:hypothetical protein
MTNREKLIELMKNAPLLNVLYGGEEEWEIAADYLLENGVICPPCKVGDTVYEIRTISEYGDYRVYSKRNLRDAIRWGEELYIKERAFIKSDKTRLGRTVFLSREDAEKALNTPTISKMEIVSPTDTPTDEVK